MKFFKQTDLLTQATLILTGLVLLCVEQERQHVFVLFYLILGGWQLFSFLIQLLFSGESWYHKKYRNRYGKTVAWTLAGIPGAALLSITQWPVLFFYLFAMLFVTPVYALGYLVICYRELQTIQRKELIHLKN